MQLRKLLLFVLLLLSILNNSILNATIWNTKEDFLSIPNMSVDIKGNVGDEYKLEKIIDWYSNEYFERLFRDNVYGFSTQKIEDEYGCIIRLGDFFQLIFPVQEGKSNGDIEVRQEVASATVYLVSCFCTRMIGRGYTFENDSIQTFDNAKELFIDGKLEEYLFFRIVDDIFIPKTKIDSEDILTKYEDHINLIGRYILLHEEGQVAITEIVKLRNIIDQSNEKVKNIISSVLLELFNYTLGVRIEHYDNLKELINSGKVENIFTEIYNENKWSMICICTNAFLSMRIKYIAECLTIFQEKVEAYDHDNVYKEINYMAIGSGNFFQDYLFLNCFVKWAADKPICRRINIFAVDNKYNGDLGKNSIESFSQLMFEKLRGITEEIQFSLKKYSGFDEFQRKLNADINLNQPTFVSLVDIYARCRVGLLRHCTSIPIEKYVQKSLKKHFKKHPSKAPYLFTTLLKNKIVCLDYPKGFFDVAL